MTRRRPPTTASPRRSSSSHDVEELPDREAMSILRPDVTIPLDADVAADVLLDQDDDESDES